jgi:hypothetical protein
MRVTSLAVVLMLSRGGDADTNVFGKRAGQASEWVKIPSGLPSITYHKTNNKDRESTTFALQTTCPSIMLK